MTDYQDVKEWRKNNKDKVNEQARRYRAKHPETNIKAKAKYREKNITIIRERDKIAQDKRRKQNPGLQRVRYERWREKKEITLTEIAGRSRPTLCELCSSDKFRIVFDHCHISGKFRGWICDQCNKVLGLVKDSREVLGKMIVYLEVHNGKINDEKEKFTS